MQPRKEDSHPAIHATEQITLRRTVGSRAIQCKYCKRMGHMERNCRQKQNRGQDRPAQHVNCAEEDEEPKANLFMVTHGNQVAAKHTWFIDSGCTSHMSKDESLFNNFDKSVKTKVTLGNGAVVEAQGRGSIAVQTKQGTKLIQNVLFIPLKIC